MAGIKTKRLRGQIKDYLFFMKEKEMKKRKKAKRKKGNKREDIDFSLTIAQIIDFINAHSRHGTTTQQIGNILSKDRDIRDAGYVKRVGSRYGSYQVKSYTVHEDFIPEEGVVDRIASRVKKAGRREETLEKIEWKKNEYLSLCLSKR